MVEHQLLDEYRQWREQSRVIAVDIMLPSLSANLTIIVAYAHAQQGEEREQFLQDIVGLAGQVRGPWILMGDLNTTCAQSPALQTMIDVGAGIDALEYWYGEDVPHTCTLGAGSTIDHILLHNALAPAIKDVRVADQPYVPAHKPLLVEMYIDEYANVPAR